MTTNQELLELAAKAANLPNWYSKNGVIYYSYNPDAGYVVWYPLTDDGDALRLAVKLGMCVTVFKASRPLGAMANTHFEEFNGSDHYTATRRAIVRAAAEIGREMK